MASFASLTGSNDGVVRCGEDSQSYAFGELANDDSDYETEKKSGDGATWVDWEDQILEDTVPLVGFVRMILHSGKLGVGLLLALLGTTAEVEDEVEGGFLLDIVVGECTTSSSCLLANIKSCWSSEMPSLSWILATMVLEDSTSRAMVFPVRVFTKIRIFATVVVGG
ncbi:unnamed protein product [Fraxinus pennsylvanica]|uniref:Uncharacterized protein n=1 Tax=Fraxinus pennsylvanica TaxID=56036 RepID=A0AAD1ZA46_9LAMI|nr:unnamed protein product [Fraxinus pennsylvanica]